MCESAYCAWGGTASRLTVYNYVSSHWLKKNFFFDVDLFLSLYWICYNFASVLCFGSLVTRLVGSNLQPPVLEGKVLVTGPPGKSPSPWCLNVTPSDSQALDPALWSLRRASPTCSRVERKNWTLECVEQDATKDLKVWKNIFKVYRKYIEHQQEENLCNYHPA